MDKRCVPGYVSQLEMPKVRRQVGAM